MKHSDIALLMKGIAPTIADFVSEAVKPLADRVVELERQLADRPTPLNGKDGAPGKDADMEAVARMVSGGIEKALVGLEPREPDPGLVRSMVVEEVSAAVAEAVRRLPPARDGRDGIDAVTPILKDGVLSFAMSDGSIKEVGNVVGPAGKDGRDGVDGLQGPQGEPGRPGERGEKGELGERGADGAPGRDGVDGSDGAHGAAGKDGTNGRDGVDGLQGPQGESGRPGERGEKGEPGERGSPGADGLNGKDGRDGLDGKDGVGLADAVIDRDGNLVLTMTDGRVKELGRIVGNDVDMTVVERILDEKVKALPVPKDGLDGIGFDDMEIALSDDERTLTISAAAGENRRSWEFRLSHVLDRGVWELGKRFQKGDGVSYAGSFFVAQEDTTDKPGSSAAWRLAVKRGRDAKEPVRLDDGPSGNA